LGEPPGAGLFFRGVSRTQVPAIQYQNFILATEDPIPQAATEFNVVNFMNIYGAAKADPTWRALETDVHQRLPWSIRVKGAVVMCDAAVAAGATATFTLRDDAAATAVVIPLVAGDQWRHIQGLDIFINAGSEVAWECIGAANPGALEVSIMLVFTIDRYLQIAPGITDPWYPP